MVFVVPGRVVVVVGCTVVVVTLAVVVVLTLAVVVVVASAVELVVDLGPLVVVGCAVEVVVGATVLDVVATWPVLRTVVGFFGPPPLPMMPRTMRAESTHTEICAAFGQLRNFAQRAFRPVGGLGGSGMFVMSARYGRFGAELERANVTTGRTATGSRFTGRRVRAVQILSHAPRGWRGSVWVIRREVQVAE